MSTRKLGAWGFTLALTWVATLDASGGGRALAQTGSSLTAPAAAAAAFVTPEELKAKLAANEPVTIIDVRDGKAYGASEEKIKGAIRIKLRRLKHRLAFAPLKDLPRDREIVTYCACPADESGIRAAEVLQGAGFKRVRTLKGGWVAWQAIGGQVEARPQPQT